MTFYREPRDAAVVGDRVDLSKRVYRRVLQFVSFRCKCKKFCVVALTMESPRNDDTTYRNRRVTNSQRAGLVFPVTRLHRYLRRSTPFRHVSYGASVYLAAVLEYLCAELLIIANASARQQRKVRITPRHVQVAIQQDEDMRLLLEGVVISNSGVLPLIHIAMLPAFPPGRSGPARQSWAFRQLDRQRYNASSNSRHVTN